MFRTIAATGFLLTVLMTRFVINAQDVSQTPPPSTVTFEQLQADYFFQLEQYRKAEERFNLDRAEFNKLQTLASREKAVESMRPYLEARARVLSTYLIALQYLLNQAQGVDILAKNQTMDRVETAKTYLRNYIQTIPSLSDRESVNASALEFEKQGLSIVLEAQYRVLTLLAIGRVQVMYDQLELATNDFKADYVANIPAESQRARIERGLKDVDFHNQAADTTLQEVIAKFPSFETPEELAAQHKPQPNFQGNYNTTVSDLQKVVGSMRQSLRFLKELERQI